MWIYNILKIRDLFNNNCIIISITHKTSTFIHITNSAFLFSFVVIYYIKPDWTQTPLDEFGAPYIVARHKETRHDTWDGHGEWAAYLCPCTRSLPETHYFLLMDKRTYSVVCRGAYRRQAKEPGWWWLELPQQDEFNIHIEGPTV